MSNGNIVNEEQGFVEFRRKVRSAEVLSAAMERLLLSLQFTGRVSVVVQNGRVFSSRATRKAISAGAMTPNPAAAGAWQTKVSPIGEPAPTGNVLPENKGRLPKRVRAVS